MALRSLHVDRFRGVRSAEVTFDRTTVLIGENDCGMSSVLGALGCALSPSDFEVRDFHAGEGPIEIHATFVESRAGSWARAGLEALEPVIGRSANKPRTLRLAITASRNASSQIETHWTVTGPGGTSRDDDDILAGVRAINPLVWLHRGAIRAGLERQLREDTTDIESGFEATKQLLSEWAPGAHAHGTELRAMVSEILEHGARVAPHASKPVSRAASPAQELGVFLVAAELVHELRKTAAPGVRPIIIFEEPETHLHPMTLASVWGLLELFSAQKIITTNSGSLLAAVPLQSLRRLVRHADGVVCQRRITRNALSSDDMRKVGYHLRTRRSTACFARVWLLVEGETEFWIMPDLARLCGYDFAQEGVACVEFAQCGLVPLIKLANNLGIEWHVLTDGDRAGAVYAETTRPYIRNGDTGLHLTRLEQVDIEHAFWAHGYAPVFERLAKMNLRGRPKPTAVIRKAIENHSKPAVAFELLEAVAARETDGAPDQLRTTIDACVWLARGSEHAPRTHRRKEYVT